MKLDVNLKNGKVKAEFSLAEVRTVLEALQPQADSMPGFELDVASFTTPGVVYKTRIWHDFAGRVQGDCQCPDHTYRNRWCKHLGYAAVERRHQHLGLLV